MIFWMGYSDYTRAVCFEEEFLKNELFLANHEEKMYVDLCDLGFSCPY